LVCFARFEEGDEYSELAVVFVSVSDKAEASAKPLQLFIDVVRTWWRVSASEYRYSEWFTHFVGL
jgi:hypothetical protein